MEMKVSFVQLFFCIEYNKKKTNETQHCLLGTGVGGRKEKERGEERDIQTQNKRERKKKQTNKKKERKKVFLSHNIPLSFQ